MDIVSTIKRVQEIADEIQMNDLLSLSSRQMGLVAELLWRVKGIEISHVDMRLAFGGEA